MIQDKTRSMRTSSTAALRVLTISVVQLDVKHFLGCIPQGSSGAVSQGARHAPLRRRYDASELHIECLFLHVKDVPPLTDTLLRTVYKNAQTTIVI